MAHVLSTEQWVPTPLDETFAFFADAFNLEGITPPFLRFRIITPPPITMRVGTLIEYRLSLYGMPMRWLTRIDRWEPGVAFVDRQVEGPYRKWVHLHTFKASDGGTQVNDRVDYELPLEPLSNPAHPLFVRPSLERIFAFRRAAIHRRLGNPQAALATR